jgi:hypothetical protein
MSKSYTYEQAQADLERRLREAGIKLQTGGCGCCGSPWVYFTLDGNLVHAERMHIDSFDDDDKVPLPSDSPADAYRPLPKAVHDFESYSDQPWEVTE